MRDPASLKTTIIGGLVVALALTVALALPLGVGAQTTGGPAGRPPRGGVTAESEPAWMRGFVVHVNAAQRTLNQALSRELRRLREGERTGAAFGVAWIAFLYGVLHAVGPGHGKLVVSSLFLARDARVGTAMAVSGLVSLLQTLSAIGVVSVVALVLDRGGLAALRDSRRVELVSYGLIAAIGLAMLAGTLYELWMHRRGGPRHAEAPPAQSRASRGLVLATGLTPCASAIIILLFALGQGVFLVGIAATLVMAVGMGLTVSAVGLLAVTARRGALRAAASSGGALHWVKGALGVVGAAAITALGIVLFLGAWSGA